MTTLETSYLFSKLFFLISHHHHHFPKRFLSPPKAISSRRSESHARRSIHSKRDVRTVDVVRENDDDIEHSFFPQTREEEKCEDDDIILRVDERR